MVHTGLKVSLFELNHGRNRPNKYNQKKQELHIRLGNAEHFSAAETITNIRGPKRKRRSDGSYNYGQEEENPVLRVTSIAKKKAVQSRQCELPIRIIEKRNQKESLEGKYKEQLRIAADGTKHTVRTADHKIFYRNLISSPIELKRSPNKDVSPNKQNLRGP